MALVNLLLTFPLYFDAPKHYVPTYHTITFISIRSQELHRFKVIMFGKREFLATS